MMRWRFIDPTNHSDAAERAVVVAKIDAWWREFLDRAEEISASFSNQGEFDLPEWMEQHLEAIHPNVMWEFGPAPNQDGDRLVITPESDHHLRPLVGAILHRAPEIVGWEFYPYRLVENFEDTRLHVEGRTGGDIADFQPGSPGCSATFGGRKAMESE